MFLVAWFLTARFERTRERNRFPIARRFQAVGDRLPVERRPFGDDARERGSLEGRRLGTQFVGVGGIDALAPTGRRVENRDTVVQFVEECPIDRAVCHGDQPLEE